MKVVLAGSTGFIGTHLVASLLADGHRCTVLTRHPGKLIGGPFPSTVEIRDYNSMPDEADAVVNLAGESVAGFWTESKKQLIEKSRIDFTKTLVAWMAGLSKRPSVFLAGSATGFYGDRGEEFLTESSSVDPQHHFLGRVCEQWEAAANEATALGVRVVNLRTSNVLGKGGGMLGKMVPMLKLSPFILPFAREAYLPWISLRDEVDLIRFALVHDEIVGPLNLVSPDLTTAGQLQAAIGKCIHRKTLGSLPNWVLSLTAGEFSQALTASQKVVPAKALKARFKFQDPDLLTCLKSLNL